jgi:hypothetical protein
MTPLTFPPAILNIPSMPQIATAGVVVPSDRVSPDAGEITGGVILTLNFNALIDRRYTADGMTVGDSRRIQMERAHMKQESEPCVTCSERTYQDGSNDTGVSFQTPTNVAPEAAASLVRAHEQEHVSREDAKARENGLNAMSTVRIHTDICHECKRVYVSGGTTTTQLTPDPDKVVDAYARQMGMLLDILVGA